MNPMAAADQESPFPPLPAGAVWRVRNGCARLLLGLLRWYHRRVRWDAGKSRLRLIVAAIVTRLGRLEARCMPVSVSGVTVNLWLPRASLIGVMVESSGAFEAAEVDGCVQALAGRPAPVLLDVGANCGLYTIQAACRVRGLRAIAVEPSPLARELLGRNLRENEEAIRGAGAAVEIVAAALAAERGEAAFHDAWDIGLGSLGRRSAPARGTMRVRTLRGDELLAGSGIERVDFCKVDVEGGEWEVLAGLEHTLAARRIAVLQVELTAPQVVRDAHTCDEIVRRLAEHGYGMTAASRARFDGGRWGLENFLFVPAAAG